MSPESLRLVLAPERRRAREALVQDAGERIPVRAPVDLATADLLGRQVIERAREQAGLGCSTVGELLREAEVAQVAVLRGVDEDVPRLHVAVHEPSSVGRVERLGDLADKGERSPGRKRPLLLEDGAQIAAVHVAGGEVELAAACLAGRVDREDAGMIERGCKARLAQEALAEGAIIRELGRDQLQRDVPVERELGCAVDDPHAAAPDDTVDPVAGQLGSELR